MKRLSAKQDLASNTLSNLPHLIERARYLCRLLETDGTLHHWGLERVHGSKDASEALSASVREVIDEILRMGNAKLWEETERLFNAKQNDPAVNNKSESLSKLIDLKNPELPKHQRLHLKFLLSVLEHLGPERSSNPADSSLSPPPDR
jgi:hypothetical protein